MNFLTKLGNYVKRESSDEEIKEEEEPPIRAGTPPTDRSRRLGFLNIKGGEGKKPPGWNLLVKLT